MPCTAKKFEVSRDDNMSSTGFQDVDVALTTRELARMLKQAGIDFNSLPEEEVDSLLGEYTGAGTIFGVTGGVMEAALRSAYFLITKEDLEDVNFMDVRGLEGVKEATIDIKGTEVRVAIAHQMGNVEAVLNKVREAKEKGEELPWHFIEVMACRGGCIGGGGQPHGRNGRNSSEAYGRPLLRRRKVGTALLAPQPDDHQDLRRVPRRTAQPQGT